MPFRSTVASYFEDLAKILDGEDEQQRMVREGLSPGMTEEELSEYRDRRVSEHINHAYNNTDFYRNLLDEENIDPEEIQTVEDLSRIPPTTGEDLEQADMDFPDYPFLATGWDEVARVNESSGTGGGDPKQQMMSYEDMERNGLEQARIYGGELGIDESDTVLQLLPFSLNTSGFTGYKGAEAIDATQLTAGVMVPPEKHAQLVDEYQPEAIIALPSYANRFTDVLEQQGIDPADSSIENVIVGGEAFTDKQLSMMEDKYDARVTQAYGMTEAGGITGGEVEIGNGMHLLEDNFIFEIVDPKTYEPVEDGEIGEVLFTPVGRDAMPLIRYAPRDFSRFRTDEDVISTPFSRIDTPWRKHNVADIEGVEIYPGKVGDKILDIDEELKREHGINGEFKITLDYEEDESQYQMDIEVEGDRRTEMVENEMKGSLFEILEFSSIDSQTVADINVDVVPKGELQTKGKAERIELTDDYREFKGMEL
ncbi:hypothetical protein AQV86_01900 [Nanohaloarchaea archaeon SG9]|nr:hypothetical protein AQV86_01900 [Nanohaloarchaea archaeon SG9]